MTDLPVKPHLLTIKQVAYIIQVHEKTVRRFIEEGKLTGHNPNGIKPGATGLRITVDSVKNYLRRFQLDEFNDDDFDKKMISIVQNTNRRRIISSGIISP
jgi:excisionase family DNA binding protein